MRADLVGREVWAAQRDASFDIAVLNADAPSYVNADRPVESLLQQKAREKHDHYQAVCEQRRMSFTPLVGTCDGAWCEETNAFIRRLADRLVTKDGWRERGCPSGGLGPRPSVFCPAACQFLLSAWRPTFVAWLGE